MTDATTPVATLKESMRRFAEANALPVACAFRTQDLFDNDHELYAGDVGIAINPKLAARVRDADVLLVAGERLGEMTTGGYTLLRVPQPGQTLIHVHPGSEELGRVFQPALAIQASSRDRPVAAHHHRPYRSAQALRQTKHHRIDVLRYATHSLLQVTRRVEHTRAIHVNLQTQAMRLAANLFDHFQRIHRAARHVMRILDLN